MKFSLGEAREAERLKQPAFLAEEFLRHELAHADHLIAMIGVGDDIDIFAKYIEHRKIIRREAA